jgi:hypothetical protein
MLDVSAFAAKHHLVGLDLEETLSMQTEWRRAQSRANPSPAVNREKYREISPSHRPSLTQKRADDSDYCQNDRLRAQGETGN